MNSTLLPAGTAADKQRKPRWKIVEVGTEQEERAPEWLVVWILFKRTLHAKWITFLTKIRAWKYRATIQKRQQQHRREHPSAVNGMTTRHAAYLGFLSKDLPTDFSKMQEDEACIWYNAVQQAIDEVRNLPNSPFCTASQPAPQDPPSAKCLPPGQRQFYGSAQRS